MDASANAVIRSTRAFLTEATAVTSNNKENGFYGQIMRSHPKIVNLSRDAATKLFGAFVSYIASKFGLKPEQARDYLDSAYGRHLGDQISDSGITDVKSLPDAVQKQLEVTVKRFKLSSELRGPRAGLTGQRRGWGDGPFAASPTGGGDLSDTDRPSTNNSRMGIQGESLRESNMSYCVFENTSKDMFAAVEKLRDVINGDLHIGSESKYEIQGLHSLAKYAKEFVELYGDGDFPTEPEASAEDEEREDRSHL